MTRSRPWLLLGTLGMLSAAALDDAGAVDTSQWKCESCPFEQGVSGSLDLGPAFVSTRSNRYGYYSGLYRKGAYLLGPTASTPTPARRRSATTRWRSRPRRDGPARMRCGSRTTSCRAIRRSRQRRRSSASAATC